MTQWLRLCFHRRGIRCGWGTKIPYALKCSQKKKKNLGSNAKHLPSNFACSTYRLVSSSLLKVFQIPWGSWSWPFLLIWARLHWEIYMCQADFPKWLLLSKGSCTPSAESQMLTSNVCNKVRVYLQETEQASEKQVSNPLVFELGMYWKEEKKELGMIIILKHFCDISFLKQR